jgi:hypothetical protein
MTCGFVTTANYLWATRYQRKTVRKKCPFDAETPPSQTDPSLSVLVVRLSSVVLGVRPPSSPYPPLRSSMDRPSRRRSTTTFGLRTRCCCSSWRLLLAVTCVALAVIDVVESSPYPSDDSGRRQRRRQQEGFLSNVTDGAGTGDQLPPLIRVWVSYKAGVTHDDSLGALQSNLEQALQLPENITNFDGLMVPDQDVVPPTRRRRTTAAQLGRELQPEEVVLNNFQMHYDFFDSGVGSIAMSVTPEVLVALKNDPTVRKVKKDPLRYPFHLVESSESSADDGATPKLRSRRQRELADRVPYGISMVNAAAAWKKGYKGQGITVRTANIGRLDSCSNLVRLTEHLCLVVVGVHH